MLVYPSNWALDGKPTGSDTACTAHTQAAVWGVLSSPMPISIVCPGCKARFSVSDHFAGRTGPCPKCKQPITIPKPAAQSVVIHEPDAPVSSSGQTGRAPTAPIKSRDKPVKVSAIMASAVGAAVCLAVAAILPRIYPPGAEGATTIPSWLLLGGAFAVAIPSVTLAYAAVRNRELEALQGMEFAKRAIICSFVYAALWGLRGILPAEQTAEMWQWLYIGPLFVTAGSLAAFASLDLDQGGAIAHYSFYALFCSLLRWMAGLLPL